MCIFTQLICNCIRTFSSRQLSHLSTKVNSGGNKMKANTRIYPNGFIFTENNIDETLLPTYYSKRKIYNKYNYYYNKQYEKKIKEVNGNFIVIHGLFAHIDLDLGDIT